MNFLHRSKTNKIFFKTWGNLEETNRVCLWTRTRTGLVLSSRDGNKTNFAISQRDFVVIMKNDFKKSKSLLVKTKTEKREVLYPTISILILNYTAPPPLPHFTTEDGGTH
jgi:hypothetical protein